MSLAVDEMALNELTVDEMAVDDLTSHHICGYGTSWFSLINLMIMV
jgi:hypothetical protein